MADGLARAAACNVNVEIGGVSYTVTPITLEVLGCCEQEMLRRRVDPLVQVRKYEAAYRDDPQRFDQIFEYALTKAFREYRIPLDEVAQWMMTHDGVVFTSWLCLKEHHNMKIEEVKSWLSKLTQDEVQSLTEAMAQAAGSDHRGNSIGRTTGQDETSQSPTGESEGLRVHQESESDNPGD